MGERFDMSRPIYAQIVERLKAKILAGVYPPGGPLRHRRYSPFGTAAGRDSPRYDRRISRKNARHRLRPGRGRKAYDGLGNKGE